MNICRDCLQLLSHTFKEMLVTCTCKYYSRDLGMKNGDRVEQSNKRWILVIWKGWWFQISRRFTASKTVEYSRLAIAEGSRQLLEERDTDGGCCYARAWLHNAHSLCRVSVILTIHTGNHRYQFIPFNSSNLLIHFPSKFRGILLGWPIYMYL